jgi:hypothetical protein
MNKIKYILRVLSGASFDKMKSSINQVHERTNKNKFLIFCSMIYCSFRYGAGYNDYLMFGFYDMNHDHRKTYMTRLKNKRLIMLLNDPAYSHVFDMKNVFNRRFKDYLKRDFFDVEKENEEDFIKFIENKEFVFAKPNTGVSGKGIEKLNKNDFVSISEMYQYIKQPEKDFGVIEESIVQHPELNVLYPNAINTLRVVTIVINNKAHLAYAVIKMGAGGKFVDNLENGGMFCPVDIDTGNITGVGHTSKLTTNEIHPDTNVKLVGFHVPLVKEAIDLCLKAAMEVEQIKFSGWDVAITPQGPCIVEGNDYPGYDFWQQPEHTPDRIGLFPFYQSLIPGLK